MHAKPHLLMVMTHLMHAVQVAREERLLTLLVQEARVVQEAQVMREERLLTLPVQEVLLPLYLRRFSAHRGHAWAI